MNTFLIDKTLGFIEKNSHHDEYELLKIRYGIEGLYLNITKIIVVLLIGLIFNYLDIVLITLLFFNILRFFAFGLHASKSIQCLVFSVLLFNVLPLILLNVLSDKLIIIISIISIGSFILFAPSDTEKRPLTNKKKRIVRKILSVIVGCIFIFLSFVYSYLKVPIMCSLIIESVMINPFSYMLLGLKYNNYKKS